eukprot:4150626-Prymnesium_polylepis.1
MRSTSSDAQKSTQDDRFETGTSRDDPPPPHLEYLYFQDATLILRRIQFEMGSDLSQFEMGGPVP